MIAHISWLNSNIPENSIDQTDDQTDEQKRKCKQIQDFFSILDFVIGVGECCFSEDLLIFD